jgi:hypothetical protein
MTVLVRAAVPLFRLHRATLKTNNARMPRISKFTLEASGANVKFLVASEG